MPWHFARVCTVHIYHWSVTPDIYYWLVAKRNLLYSPIAINHIYYNKHHIYLDAQAKKKVVLKITNIYLYTKHLSRFSYYCKFLFVKKMFFSYFICKLYMYVPVSFISFFKELYLVGMLKLLNNFTYSKTTALLSNKCLKEERLTKIE